MRGLTEKTCIFSKTGLLDFTETGKISDIPDTYMAPVHVEDRIQLLKSLRQCIETGTQAYHMVNPLTFPVSEHLFCALHKDSSLDFNYLSQHNTSYSYIHLTEGTLVEAFSDFFPYLAHSHLVYPEDETMKLVDRCIDKLESEAG